MARQNKSRSESEPVTLAQFRDLFTAYRRSVGDYHQASSGADSARAAGVIDDSHEALVRFAVRAGLPTMPPEPPVNCWHGDWSGWGPWLRRVNHWGVEVEARLSIQKKRADGVRARKPSREQQAELKFKLLAAITARGPNASPIIIIQEAHVNRNRALKCLHRLAKEGHYKGFKRLPRHSAKTHR
jgi:hypothetical protein